MEPFYQLSRPGGVTAESSLCLEYSSFLPFVLLWKALKLGHFTVVISTVLSLCAMVIVSLAPETVHIGLVGSCSATSTGCAGQLSVVHPVARAVEALLGLMAVLVTGLMALLWNRRSGVYSEPFMMAGVGTLLGQQRVLTQLRMIKWHNIRSKSDLDACFKGSVYRIGLYTDANGVKQHGIVAERDPSFDTLLSDPLAMGTPGPRGAIPRFSELRWTSPFQFAALLLGIVLGGLLALIVYYYNYSGKNEFERFMDSQGFGVRFLFTAVGVLVKVYWDKLFEGMPFPLKYVNPLCSNLC